MIQASFLLLCLLVLAQCAQGFTSHVPRAFMRGQLHKKPPGRQQPSRPPRSTSNHPLLVRGGGLEHFASTQLVENLHSLAATPSALFNTVLGGLASSAVLWKGMEARQSLKHQQNDLTTPISPAESSLRWRFLAVFWLLRMADWLQGPYFYEVYSSKIISGKPVGVDMVSKLFLVGFATTGLFGPCMGRFVDNVGRRAGSLLYTLLYSLGALSTRSSSLPTLLAGRLAGGLGTSLLFSAPEAWLVAEHTKINGTSAALSQTFGWAYAGDSIAAISAGQLASMAATRAGPSAPFTVSVGILASAAVLMMLTWRENTGNAHPLDSKKPSIAEALTILLQDKRMLLLGAVQALFEGAMYIFVLQWPPAMKAVIRGAWLAGDADAIAVPYGTIFSCFMAACLLGSSAFSTMSKRNMISVEAMAALMLIVSAASMTMSTVVGLQSLPVLITSFLLFEACVGMYFPCMGTLRSAYLPDSHRSVIMTLFGIPLNLIVIAVFLNIHKLGTSGALACASGALTIAAFVMGALFKMKPAAVQVNG